MRTLHLIYNFVTDSQMMLFALNTVPFPNAVVTFDCYRFTQMEMCKSQSFRNSKNSRRPS